MAKDIEMKEPEQKKFKIVIPSGSGAGGSDDVFVGANGRQFLIKRDVEVEVPAEVIDGLNNATMTEYITDENGRMIAERQVPRFPYQVKG